LITVAQGEIITHLSFPGDRQFGGVGLVPVAARPQAGASADDVMRRLRGAAGSGWAGRPAALTSYFPVQK